MLLTKAPNERKGRKTDYKINTLKFFMVETFIMKLPAIIRCFAVEKQILVLEDFCFRKLFIVIQIHFFNKVKSL